jgi:hypothetical protein
MSYHVILYNIFQYLPRGNWKSLELDCFLRQMPAVEPRLARLALMIMDSIRSLLWAMFMSLGGWLLRLLGYGFDWKLGRGSWKLLLPSVKHKLSHWNGHFGICVYPIFRHTHVSWFWACRKQTNLCIYHIYWNVLIHRHMSKNFSANSAQHLAR